MGFNPNANHNVQLDAQGQWGAWLSQWMGVGYSHTLPQQAPSPQWFWPGAVPAYGNWVNVPASSLNPTQQSIIAAQPAYGATASAETRGLAVRQALANTYQALLKQARGG